MSLKILRMTLVYPSLVIKATEILKNHDKKTK